MSLADNNLAHYYFITHRFIKHKIQIVIGRFSEFSFLLVLYIDIRQTNETNSYNLDNRRL